MSTLSLKNPHSVLAVLKVRPRDVIEIRDRERLAAVLNPTELASEERAALAAFDGNMSRTADALGVERSNLYRKMRALGLKKDDEW